MANPGVKIGIPERRRSSIVPGALAHTESQRLKALYAKTADGIFTKFTGQQPNIASLKKREKIRLTKTVTGNYYMLPDKLKRNTMYSIIYKQEQAHEDSIWSCAWRKNQNNGTDNIVTGSVDDTVKLWRWTGDRMELRYNLEGHQLGIVSVDINYLGTMAASSSLDSHIKLWDLDAGKQIRTLDAGPVDCWTLSFSPDGKSLATGSHTGKVNVFGIDSGKKETTLDTRGKFTMSVAYSPDGKYVACGAIDGIINIFDMTSGKLMHTLEGHAMPVRSLSFSPDSQLLVTASDDSHIKLYDVQNATLISNMTGHQSWVLSVDFSPDNAHFVTSSSDRTVKIWEVSSKSCIHTFYDHVDQVWCAKYNSTGSNIVTVGDDRYTCIYECPL